DPVFWDPKYVSEHEKLIIALGKYSDSHPGTVDFVDLGGMGDWGEMHLSRWKTEELVSHGFSLKVYLQSVLSMMEQMDRYLPATRKAFCVAPIGMEGLEPVFSQLVERAVRHGWWLRTDGFSIEGPAPYVKPYFEKHWQRTGIILE